MINSVCNVKYDIKQTIKEGKQTETPKKNAIKENAIKRPPCIAFFFSGDKSNNNYQII